MSPATPQRTDRGRRADPAPTMLPEITWVVEIGSPRLAVVSSTPAADVCAANPCAGSSGSTRWPSVRMIRQPPA